MDVLTVEIRKQIEIEITVGALIFSRTKQSFKNKISSIRHIYSLPYFTCFICGVQYWTAKISIVIAVTAVCIHRLV